MKKRWIAIYFICLFLPYLAVLVLGKTGYFDRKPPNYEEPEGYTVTLYNTLTEKTELLELRDYLWGVVAGEMPASYPEEALKAQTVAAYSYLLHRKATVAAHPGTDFGHPGDICDDPNHCKAYCPPAQAIARWGADWFEASSERITAAVETVLGVAVLYEGEPANTVFHSLSGGRTEDAADVWGADVPYLRSVDSHWDADAKDFLTEYTFSLEEFQEILGQTDCTLGAAVLTAGGSVETQVIGGKSYTGRELRELFGLRSTHFILTVEKETVTIQVSGYGHQVGLSQYGASVLAQNGYSYREILSYYYTGVEIVSDYYPAS